MPFRPGRLERWKFRLLVIPPCLWSPFSRTTELWRSRVALDSCRRMWLRPRRLLLPFCHWREYSCIPGQCYSLCSCAYRSGLHRKRTGAKTTIAVPLLPVSFFGTLISVRCSYQCKGRSYPSAQDGLGVDMLWSTSVAVRREATYVPSS